jgi:hypothetical protein
LAGPDAGCRCAGGTGEYDDVLTDFRLASEPLNPAVGVACSGRRHPLAFT